MSFECKSCSKVFASSKSLKAHEIIHCPEKSFKCKYCQKSFSVQGNLVVHLRIHTQEKPFQCKLCKRPFDHSGNLKRHLNSHYTDYGFQCFLCSQLFDQEEKILEHTKQQHEKEYLSYIKKNTGTTPRILPSTSALVQNIPVPNTTRPSSKKGKCEVDKPKIDIQRVVKSSISEKSPTLNIGEMNSLYQRPECDQLEEQIIANTNGHTNLSKLNSDHKLIDKPFCNTESSVSTETFVDISNTGKRLLQENYQTPLKENCNSSSFSTYNPTTINSSPAVDTNTYLGYSDPPPLIPIEELNLNLNEASSNEPWSSILESNLPSELSNSQNSFRESYEGSTSSANYEHFENKKIEMGPNTYPSQHQSINKTQENHKKETFSKIHLNFLNSLLGVFHFRKKVEKIIRVLVNEQMLEEIGQSDNNVEQVLLNVLDRTNTIPCSDVRVLELDRFKINVRLLIEKTFPDKQNWKRLGWEGKSTEYIMDQILLYEN
ncbi:UNVERIFIED_CONTAM: hypothetical protein GTU68_049461 [Idotea baltica]|nr:hypothetical protein [Idotea baltica]